MDDPKSLSPSVAKRHAAVAKRQAAAAIRRKVFAERWLVNGNNASEAAIHAGWSAKTSRSTGSQILKEPDVQAIIGTRIDKVLHEAELTTERWAKEMACIGHFDPGELYDENDNLIPLNKLPEHVRRAIGSIDIDQRYEGKGDDARLVTTTKIKPWDKNQALANIGKHLGVFEKDNQQKVEPIHVTVTFVGKLNGPARRASAAGETPLLDGSAQIQSSVRRA